MSSLCVLNSDLLCEKNEADILIQRLLGLHVPQVCFQQYNTVAWGLAVMGILKTHMFGIY